MAGVALQPLLYDVVVELFRPEQAGEALAHYVLGVGGKVMRNNRGVEIVGFLFASGEEAVEIGEGGGGLREVEIRETQADAYGRAPRRIHRVMNCRFSACSSADRLFVSVDDVVVDGVFFAEPLSGALNRR
jgi:hypothetical protein